MSTHSAPPGGRRHRPAAPAAVPAVIRSGQGRQPNLYEGLRGLSPRFDQLLYAASIASSPRQFDELADEAVAIAGELRTLARGRGPSDPVHPPLRHRNGEAWW